MKYLYSSPLPEAAATNESDSLGQQLAELGFLDGDSAAVESISSQAADLTLEGQLRWGEQLSSMLAAEIDELSDAGLAQLPLYQRGGGYANQGYYEVASATVEPLHANRRDVWSYELNLTFVGKRASHFRAVETGVWQVDHPWGNTLEVRVGAPAAARKTRWLDRETGVTEPASAVATMTGEQADIDLFDVEAGEVALGISNPTLIYETAYADDVRVGVRAYDTQGNSAKFTNSGSGPRQWQVIHSSGHDIDHSIVLSNGLLRVQLDERSSPNITAEEWDDTAGSWTSVDAVATEGANTDWELYDIDITTIGMSDVRAQLEFEHPVEGLFDLNASLQSGRDRVLFWVPEGEEGPVPSGLETWLESIAADWITDPSQVRGLVSRREVRD